MSLIINHNISALNTHRNLKLTDHALSKSLQKLSSGYKINVAADDPSGLIISEQLRSQTLGLQRAIRNSQEASNVLGITEGALIEMNEILRKLRSLALHAANSGVTAPDQVRADQAEVDSSIQTLDRIANTTRYSDQFLLNGSKGIVFDRNTVVDDTMDMSLLDIDNTRVDQIFKREGVAMNVAFTGILSTTQPDYRMQAARAYMEADDNNVDAEINGHELTSDQSFIITGTSGSRLFRFGSGTTLGSVVSSINNVNESTGVGAALIFSSNVEPRPMISDTPATGPRASGQVDIYGTNLATKLSTNAAGNTVELDGTTGGTFNQRIIVGKNTDGHGRIYVQVSDVTDIDSDGNNEIVLEYYKDKDKTMLVGTGGIDDDGTPNFAAANNSGFVADDILLWGDNNQLAEGDEFVLAFAGMEINADNDGTNDYMDSSQMTFQGLDVDSGATSITGVDLGHNTDESGQLYFRMTGNVDARTIEVYRDSDMDKDNLVAKAENIDLDPAPGAYPVSARIVAQNDSGLNMTLTFDGTPSGSLETGSLLFNEQGMRLYSMDYGSEEYIRVQNQEGKIWQDYRDPDGSDFSMVDVGTTVQQTGRDAQISLNGTTLGTNGLVANVTTPDFSGKFTFNEGTLGDTRIAQAGHDVGGLYSRAGAFQAVEDDGTATIDNTFTYATNARHFTTEVLDNFIGGMQYQLGEGAGDQERTVYGIQSMAAANVGHVDIENVTYTLQDVLAGGTASLSKDPIIALRVVTQAINDVSDLRARLGAFQKNMLQTNINSLNVSVENITATESAIRDADMAAETTEFTKNQILMQAGTAMLAQANTASQNILQLLG